MHNSRKVRLDVLLVRKQLAESRARAKRLIMAGSVMVNGHLATKPGHLVSQNSDIWVKDALPFVSRGGSKLQGALEVLGLEVSGAVVADVGASTGGFTDCLLQRGAQRVYAIDVGYGQLAWSLRSDERVVVMERTNIRHLQSLPEPVDLATIDASFISLTLVLPAVRRLLTPDGQVVALVKPQFEAGRDRVGKGGVVRDPLVHREVLSGMVEWSLQRGWSVLGLVPSPLRGPAGNVEFFLWLSIVRGQTDVQMGLLVDECIDAVQAVR
jgi:23S rRNA (cytidine1920-2'-O)/16S rRNA (cytidine1409-2'-O)-methyltransferase